MPLEVSLTVCSAMPLDVSLTACRYGINNQEIPAVYVNAFLDNLVAYTGIVVKHYIHLL